MFPASLFLPKTEPVPCKIIYIGKATKINLWEILSHFQVFPSLMLSTSARKIHSQSNKNHSSQRQLLTAPPCSIKHSGCRDHKSLYLSPSYLCIVLKLESDILFARHIPALLLVAAGTNMPKFTVLGGWRARLLGRGLAGSVLQHSDHLSVLSSCLQICCIHAQSGRVGRSALVKFSEKPDGFCWTRLPR